MRGKARIPAADGKIRENQFFSVCFRFILQHLPSRDKGERASGESDESPSRYPCEESEEDSWEEKCRRCRRIMDVPRRARIICQ